MSRAFTPKVITANSLRAGDVVYLGADDRWVGDLRNAELIEDEAIAQLRLVQASRRTNEVVGVYLAEARAGTNGPVAVHFREDFRARGPSNHPHGKQEHHVPAD
jgi:hypothetical protein